MTWIGPIRLTSIIDRQCRWVSCSTVPHADIPAMFITMSIAGWWRVNVGGEPRRPRRSRRYRAPDTRGPEHPARGRRPRSASSPSALTSVRYSSAPSRASRSAVARPMPLAAPVMNTLLPAKPSRHGLACRPVPPQSACSQSFSRMRTALSISRSGPTNAESPANVKAVVAARVRTKPRRSSLIGMRCGCASRPRRSARSG